MPAPRMWREHELKSSYDVVIIGGGVHGLATAYYLNGDTAAFEGARDRALQLNPGYAELYNTLADMAVQNRLYAQAVESTRNLESGNVQLKKTIKRRGEGSFIVGIVLFIATFSLLFLDWLQG